MCNTPLFHHICRESYNQPRAVYERLKRLGMNLVTVTDHDSVGAAEELRRFPDFFSSVEITCYTPGGGELHAGVYDLDERQHIELQRRAADLMSMLAYLSEQRLFFSVNHAFSALTGRRAASDFELFEDRFPAVEILNGQMPGLSNRAARLLAARSGKAPLAGSDAHTMRSLGSAYTEVPGARNKREFLDGLRCGRGVVHGTSGDFGRLTQAVWEIGLSLMREKGWAVVFAPLLAVVPLVTLAHSLHERRFAKKWMRRSGLAQSGPTVWLGRPGAEITSA